MVEGLPKLERVVVIPYINEKADIDLKAASLPSECNATFFPDFVGDDSGTAPDLAFEQVRSCFLDLVNFSGNVGFDSSGIRDRLYDLNFTCIS